MAALRQLLNARAMVTGQERSSPSPTEDEQRRNEKIMNYSNPPPAVPSKAQSTSKTTSPEQPRQLHSKFNDVDNQAWQHPLHRQNSDLNASYNRGNSFDQGTSFVRPAPLRTQTDTNVLSIEGSELDRSSFYEENESPALSPALNKHLALRPLNTQNQSSSQEQQSHDSPQKTHTRRRSRSATQDGYYGASENAWDGYGSKGHKPRQSSLQKSNPMMSSSDTEQSSGVMQLLRDRQGRTPQPEPNVRPILSKNTPLLSRAHYLTQIP